MKFSNDFWKQQNDSSMVADGHGLSSTAPQLLSLPLASVDARFSPNAPPHHQKPCGCLRAQTAARCSADGGAVQAGRDARGCVGAGGARALVHSSGASRDGSVRARCRIRQHVRAHAAPPFPLRPQCACARANHKPDHLPAARRCCAAADRLAGPHLTPAAAPRTGAAHRRRHRRELAAVLSMPCLGLSG
jgi:hypothetical protein